MKKKINKKVFKTRKFFVEADFVNALFFSLTDRKLKDNERVIFNSVLISLFSVKDESIDIDLYNPEILGAMKLFKDIAKNNFNIERTCEATARMYIENNLTIPGFIKLDSSKKEEPDLRAMKLILMARNQGLKLDFVNIARQLEHSFNGEYDFLAYFDTKVAINVNGAIASLLLSLEIDLVVDN